MRLRAGAVACVLVAVAGCTPSDGGSAPPPEPSESPEETEAEPSPEEAALLAYESMWDVVVEASHEGEPDPPDLSQFASGDALELMLQTLQGAAEDGQSVEGEPVLNPQVVDVSPEAHPDTVVLVDCADGSGWIVQDEDDSDEGPTGDRQIDATVDNDGLSWRVSELRIWEPGTC